MAIELDIKYQEWLEEVNDFFVQEDYSSVVIKEAAGDIERKMSYLFINAIKEYLQFKFFGTKFSVLGMDTLVTQAQLKDNSYLLKTWIDVDHDIVDEAKQFLEEKGFMIQKKVEGDQHQLVVVKILD